ncbi:hypothetical protein CHLNCDRAFT_57178 [Chlorella variabilis]|uniref:GPI inositol-deacylase n=1 Tax=Chlorella variabilis TaxID=554065 RepID=E1Z8J2_CHLVA|nr:hypothetical protein CHLNCDRAFT_57178 [Chlorella variabilis]EFN57345.1 hypothetical protein CHLNCDRAFT_57178 [Chlorella variabilis]|eukprot:XP_005849447.1 hypothetical protein CHLNCDRAFT_57178 [Chlorella variabilis]
MRHWLACAAFALAALPLATLLRAYWLPRSCDTTYLWEGYEQVPLTQIHSRYRLIRFKDADPERREVYKKLQRLHVVPVLFVHGHLGTHQQMRSAASETGRELARRLTANASWPLWLQWYSTDFNAEASALDAALLDKQAEFVVRCIQHLLRIHSSSNRHKPFRLVLVGYSMGGMVARDVVRRLSAYAAEGFDPSYLVALVCLGSPHHFPAFVPRVLLSTVLKPAKAKEQAAASVIAAAAPRVNIMAGAGDFSLPLTHPSAATPLAPESGPQLSTLMRDMPGVWSTGSHKGIVSCNQLAGHAAAVAVSLPRHVWPLSSGACSSGKGVDFSCLAVLLLGTTPPWTLHIQPQQCGSKVDSQDQENILPAIVGVQAGAGAADSVRVAWSGTGSASSGAVQLWDGVAPLGQLLLVSDPRCAYALRLRWDLGGWLGLSLRHLLFVLPILCMALSQARLSPMAGSTARGLDFGLPLGMLPGIPETPNMRLKQQAPQTATEGHSSGHSGSGHLSPPDSPPQKTAVASGQGTCVGGKPATRTYQLRTRSSSLRAAWVEMEPEGKATGAAAEASTDSDGEAAQSGSDKEDEEEQQQKQEEKEKAPSRKRVGRPLAYNGNPDAPHLTDQERRKIKRRIANRESARRVRAKRAELMDELQARQPMLCCTGLDKYASSQWASQSV